jgi:hypothetical protein
MPFLRREDSERIIPSNYILEEIQRQERAQEAEVAQKELAVEEARKKIELQMRLINFLAIIFFAAFLVTTLVILCQGFGIWGFNLDQTTINILAGAVIGEIAGLLTILINNSFRQEKEDKT